MLLGGGEQDDGNNDNIGEGSGGSDSDSSSGDSDSGLENNEGDGGAPLSSSQDQNVWSFYNQADVAPRLDPNQDDVLEQLGLKPQAVEKSTKNQNATEHLANFASHVDIYRHTERDRFMSSLLPESSVSGPTTPIF